MNRLKAYGEYARLRATAFAGDNDTDADEFHRLGMKARHEGLFEVAERSLRRATRLAPERPDLHAALGIVLYERGNYDEAAESFGTALTINPKHEDALLGMGTTLHVSGRVSDAIFYYLSYLRLQPESVAAMTNLGSAFALTGQSAEASDMFERALDLQPDNPEVHAAYGRALFDVGRVDAAFDQLRLAIDAESSDPDVYWLLGLALIGKDDLPGARDLLERAVDLKPAEVAPYIDLTALLIECGDLQKAVEYASRGAELADKQGADDTLRAHAYWQLGWAYYKVSEWRTSAEASNRAVELDPKLVAARFNLALALLRAGDVTAARAQYERALEVVEDALDIKSLGINDLKAALSEDGRLEGGAEILKVLEFRYQQLLDTHRTAHTRGELAAHERASPAGG